MFHSAALKLTFWYLGIIMAISLVFSVSLYHVSSADLQHNVNRQIGYFNNFLGPDDTSNYRDLRSRQLSEDLKHLKGNLFLFNMFVLATGGAASYLLARRTLEPIETAMASQSRFASDASHELRTPLTAIQTENEVALRNKSISKAQAVELLKSNLEEVAKLKMLSEGLLRLAKGEGTITEPQPIPLNVPVSEAVARYESLAKSKKITLIDKTKPQVVSGDMDSLRELVAILIDNAIKYSELGSAIQITSDKKDNQIILRVKDNGSGISRDDLPRIFERFYRSDNSRARSDGGGYGLGLAIAKNIAEVHGGHIEVASTLGKGSVFSVFLPAEQ
jgi:two-component system sensor histidine kinase CiaH